MRKIRRKEMQWSWRANQGVNVWNHACVVVDPHWNASLQCFQKGFFFWVLKTLEYARWMLDETIAKGFKWKHRCKCSLCVWQFLVKPWQSSNWCVYSFGHANHSVHSTHSHLLFETWLALVFGLRCAQCWNEAVTCSFWSSECEMLLNRDSATFLALFHNYRKNTAVY